MARLPHAGADANPPAIAYLVIPIPPEPVDDNRPPRPPLDRLTRRNLCRWQHRLRHWQEEVEAKLAVESWGQDEELRDFLAAEIGAVNRELILRHVNTPPRPLADPGEPVSLYSLIEAAEGGGR